MSKLEEGFVEIDPQKLMAELRRIHDKAKSSSESSSTLGHQRNTSAEQLGVHSKALSMIEQMDKMSEEKRADFLRSFFPMFQAMYAKWEEEAEDLLSKLEKGDKDIDGAAA